MAKKRLIVCCDGTWNDADGGEDFTNVVRMVRAIKAEGALPQIVYYHSGVGTGGDTFVQFAGGAVGLGLSRNVRDAYAFLANNYCNGDEIFLFGFSRGAYTARSVAGLVGWIGLLHKGDMDDFNLVWENYRTRRKPDWQDQRPRFAERHNPVPIKCIGVWDTVGALGIPGHMDVLFTEFYQFFDTALGANVENAFHALAIDEHREDFLPTLWTNWTAGQTVEQVWFTGAHSNVGGGYDEHGLSDIALAWMAGQVADMLDLDESYLRTRQDRRNGWGLGPIVDSASGLFSIRKKINRDVAGSFASGAKLHESVGVRLGADLPNGLYVLPGLPAGPPPDAVLKIPFGTVEQRLRWDATDPNPTGAPVRPDPGFLDRVLHGLGGG